ncbi:GTP-binding protein YchF [Denitrovibrio acetiphilus DSM 12809]|uniref:Ribosome-binding ATPase YchF n=1 Tax=Denitrovibrio acetiphilus (strain DSM 12809 / NBRC 114555 / N2460) TaxID=522772 RepID=D4H1D1_DENA2|nr:redox-regulated ATPase YchF [Denitrovibrio acetiphilus]ADD66879.1 GTP-binding protein YchF [Denitrovibrio acetiphilus DSM 12809]
MGFNCGIVGLPNVGKSTIFNALTKAGAESANYPFCTIDPNKGIVPVLDDRQDFIIQYVKPKSVVRTTIEFVDIAGLVKGASKGEGLGNQFLTNIRQVDAVAHVVRCFDGGDITHVEGSVDPIRDIEIINTELLLSDMEIIDRAVERLRKSSKSGDKELIKKFELLSTLQGPVAEGKLIREIDGYEEIVDQLSEYSFITAKPVMYVMNVEEDELLEDNEHARMVREHAAKEGAVCVKICGKIEQEISELEADEAKEFLADLGLEKSGLTEMTEQGYKLLDLITFFTAGEKEVRAWTITQGTTAQKAAGKIHSDIERGFIRAETVGYGDFAEIKSLTKAKELGKMRLEGKEYIVQDGDIIYFRFNV